MSDPLSDPRADRLLSSDIGEIASLAGGFHTVAGQARTAAAGLRGAQNDAAWTGGAAAAFRAQVGKLPGDLDKVHQSYGEVAAALDTYAHGLEPIQIAFRRLAEQLQNSQSSLSSAQSQLSTAKGNLSNATSAAHATSTTPAVVDAHNAVRAAGGSVGRLQDDVSGLESRAMSLLDEFDTIRGQARSTVSSAAGIAPSQGWFSSMMHSIGNFVDGVAKGIGKSVWDLVSGKAIINFIEHPSWKTFGELAKDVAVTASLVAMVAAPFAAPELAEADAVAVGADAAVDGATDAAADAAADAAGGAAGDAAGDGASTFAKGARVVSDNANRVVTAGGLTSSVSDAEQGKWGEAAVDLAFTAGPNLGHMPTGLDDVHTFGDQFSNALGAGERQADAAKEGLEGLKDFDSWQGAGLNPVAAKQISFPDGEFPTSASGFDLTNLAGRQAAIADAKALAAKTAARAIHVGRPVAIGFDNVIGDPSSEAIKHHVSPEPSCG
jgi:uncharacterized phage infection (PIP) family protein YhgE